MTNNQKALQILEDRQDYDLSFAPKFIWRLNMVMPSDLRLAAKPAEVIPAEPLYTNYHYKGWDK